VLECGVQGCGRVWNRSVILISLCSLNVGMKRKLWRGGEGDILRS